MCVPSRHRIVHTTGPRPPARPSQAPGSVFCDVSASASAGEAGASTFFSSNSLARSPVLVHRHDDVAAADELLVDVELRDRGPVRVLLDACASGCHVRRVSTRDLDQRDGGGRGRESRGTECHVGSGPPAKPSRHTAKHAPALRSGSSSTLKAANLAGSTPCRPSTWMLAREKPHWGVSGVPFMKRTTGADATARSMACRVSSERSRRCRADSANAGLQAVDGAAGRAAARRRRVWSATRVGTSVTVVVVGPHGARGVGRRGQGAWPLYVPTMSVTAKTSCVWIVRGARARACVRDGRKPRVRDRSWTRLAGSLRNHLLRHATGDVIFSPGLSGVRVASPSSRPGQWDST